MATQDLTLASATLSGGARLVTAGSGLPTRLTTADDLYFTSAALGLAATNRGGVCFDPDNLHIWITTATALRKIRLSDGAVIANITSNASDGGTRTIASPQSLVRRGNKLYAGNTGANNWLIEVDMPTLVCRLYAQVAGLGAVVTAPYHVISDGTNLWARTGNNTSGTYQEFTLSGTGDTATATGTARTFGGGTCFEAFVDNAGTYIWTSAATVLSRIKVSDLSVTSFTFTSTTMNLPSHNSNTMRGAAYDPLEDKMVAHPVGSDTWWYVKQDVSGAEKRLGGVWEQGGALAEVGTTYKRSSLAWSDDGTMFAHFSVGSGFTHEDIRVINVGVQRARWTWTPGAACTVKRFTVPGEFGNMKGIMSNMPATPGFFSTLADFRKTRLFYSVNGGARTEYFGGQLSLSLAAGDVLTFDVDFQHLVVHPTMFAPYVGGDSGEGPQISYDSAVIPRRGRVLGGM